MNAGAMGAQTSKRSCAFVTSMGKETARLKIETSWSALPAFSLLEQNFAVSAKFRGSPAPARYKLNHVFHESQEKTPHTQPICKGVAGCISKSGEMSGGKLVDELGFKKFVRRSARLGSAR